MEQRNASEPVRTTLVHRATRGPAPWWHSCAIYVPPTIMTANSIDEVESACRLQVSLGFDAALLCPAVSLFTAEFDALKALVARGHEAGARVLLRLPDRVFTGLGDPDLDLAARRAAVLVLVRAAIEAGADGVDLHLHAQSLRGEGQAGVLARSRFSELVRLVEAEAEAESDENSPMIVTAAIEGSSPAEIRSHLEEEWFHHLREDALRSAGFEASAIEQALSESLNMRDQLGAITAWSLPLSDASNTEHFARLLHALSLPGAIRALASDSPAHPLAPSGDTWLNTVRQALTIRSSAGLGTGSLGLVHGLSWCHDDASVHLNGPIMVVLNTSTHSLAVPRTATLLLSSQATEATVSGETLVPALSCAWFETPRIRPATASYWD